MEEYSFRSEELQTNTDSRQIACEEKQYLSEGKICVIASKKIWLRTAKLIPHYERKKPWCLCLKEIRRRKTSMQREIYINSRRLVVFRHDFVEGVSQGVDEGCLEIVLRDQAALLGHEAGDGQWLRQGVLLHHHHRQFTPRYGCQTEAQVSGVTTSYFWNFTKYDWDKQVNNMVSQRLRIFSYVKLFGFYTHKIYRKAISYKCCEYKRHEVLAWVNHQKEVITCGWISQVYHKEEEEKLALSRHR